MSVLVFGHRNPDTDAICSAIAYADLLQRTTRPDAVAAAEARVRQLAESFGGDPARWPEADRLGAEAWIAAHPAEARHLLDDARSLDRLLFAWEAPRPTEGVRSRVQSAAPVQVRQSLRRSWVLTLTGGAALAAACLAGIVAAPRLVEGGR